MDIDVLINALVTDAQVRDGQSAERLLKQGAIVRPMFDQEIRQAQRAAWTDAEEQFYLDHLADMSMEEIAYALGRSENAVKIYRYRRGLPSHRRTPGYLTTHQVAKILGVDNHNPPLWVDNGIMPGERAPFENVINRRVKWVQFKMWLIRPTSWLYFDVNRIQGASLRRLVQLAQQRWGDEWWSTRQAADFLKCEPSDVERQVQLGRIYGYQARMIGGRNPDQRWTLWFVRRSEIEQLSIPRRKGGRRADQFVGWTQKSDDFILRAHGSGKPFTEIARMMGWNVKRVAYRYKILITQGPNYENK
jgi:hypothetical protein